MSGHSQFQLLRERRFGPFFATQFLGALNDNLLKNALVVVFTYQAAAWSARSAGELVNITMALFIPRPFRNLPLRPIALAAAAAVAPAEATPERLQAIVRDLRGDWR